jgi:dihydrofolate synthase/folylpolyglutamate synthase
VRILNYKEALRYIENTGKFGINLGLQRIKRLCELLGNPEKKLKVIHVGGTNGKGSTTTFISSVLINQGYRVGIYTSPYIERFTERIKINHDEICEDDVARLVTDMVPYINKVVDEGLEHPTEFEIITAAAFKYFAEREVDFVVLEVGLGGRYDATNVITPTVSTITTISFDHVNVLGNTLSQIANEKAGIIKEGRPVVIYPQEKEAMDVLLNTAKEQNSKVHLVGDWDFTIKSDTVDGIVFDVKGRREYKDLKINLLGLHQVMNSLTALTTIEVLRDEGYKIYDEAIYKGFEAARWPGRFEILHRSPYVVLDGGHNIQGIGALVNAIRKYFPEKTIKIACGMLKDKDYSDMVKNLVSVGDYFITVTPNSDRALTSQELKQVFEEQGKPAFAAQSIEEAVKKGLEITKEDEALVFCGSLYMIGEARTILKNILNKK